MNSIDILRGPRCLVIGEGVRDSVGAHAAALADSAFVVTDQRFSQTEEFADIWRSLEQAGVTPTVFADTKPEVPADQVNEAAAAANDHGVIVAVGGGSCMDLAKATAVVVTHGGAVLDYIGENRVPGPVAPIIALPTTAGTGSEVTPVAVLNSAGLKMGISSPYLIPHTALVDPELTYTCPAGLTAMVGADALSHCVESHTAICRSEGPQLAVDRVFVGAGELTSLYALEGLRLVNEYLERAVADGSDRQARAGMARAATLAGLSFGTAGNAVAHAMQYPIGARTHTSHGTGVGILLPYVMRFNRDASLERFAQMGRVLGAPLDASAEQQADFGIERVTEILANIGIQTTLADIGFTEQDVAQAAEATMKSARLVDNNPRPVTVAEVTELFQAALRGPLG